MGEDLLEILDYLPDREDEALAQSRFRTPEFCARFLKKIDELRMNEPQSALAPARFAIRLAARLPNPLFGRAWTVWASVHRTLANYDKAELGHHLASLYLEDPVDLARFYRRRAYLHSDRGDFSAARKDIHNAISIYLAARNSHSRGCALVDLGVVHFAEKNIEEAVLRISESLRYLNPELDPEYHEAAVHNLAVALAHCDQPGAWLEVLLREIRRKRYSPASMPWAKHRWLEGLIFKRRGRHQRAEVTLRAARNQLVRLGAVHDAGLAMMDLAELYMSTGDWDKTAKMAREMFPVFKTLGLEHEAVAALRLYMKAAVARTLTQAQIQEVRDILRRLSRAAHVRP